VSEIVVELGSVDDARSVERRRGSDDETIRLALEFAEQGTVWVVRDAGEIIGVAIAHDSEDERYAGDLFVEPSYRARGVARELLGEVFRDCEDRTRSMLVDPSDPACVALALRQRLPVRESLVRLAGAIPREEELAKMAAGDYHFGVEPVDPSAHAFALRALDRQTRGTARERDHVDFAQRATGSGFFLNGEFVAYAYVWPDGRAGPIACASQSYLVQILAYALLTLTRRYSASWCTMLVPGSNLRVARASLRGGLRITQTLAIASDSFERDLSAYVAGHELSL
jgi:GNAT superfamily N-acetyltransferase